MERTDRLSLAYLMADQASKHVTVNETVRMLDTLVQLSVRSRTTDSEPAAPAPGDAYILTSGRSGDNWDTFSANHVAAYQDNAWMTYAPAEGVTAYVADEGGHVVWDGTAWVPAGGEQLSRLGINTSAEETTRLSVKTDHALLSHDDVTPGTGDMRLYLNKASALDTVSVVLQSAFSGRVEFGLTASDDFTLRVSANGTDFVDAIVVDHTTGEVRFPNTPDLGSSAPAWVPAGASFAISAEQQAVWTIDGNSNADLLSPASAPFSAGTNPLVETDGGNFTTAATGDPRRSYDADASAWGYATDADAPQLPNGAPAPPQLLGMGQSYDFVVDPVTGNDGNAGTPEAPVATLGGLQTRVAATPAGSTLIAFIHAADYVDDPFLTVLDDRSLTLVFEPGATIRSTETGVVSTQAIDVVTGTLTIYGNGLHVRDWQGLEEIAANDYQNSSNGIAAHSTGTVIVHDTLVSNCGDGLTAHGSARYEAYRCRVEDCDKYAVSHVGTSTSYHEECTFIGGDGHGGQDVRPPSGIIGGFEGGPGDHEFVRCRFLPSPNGATVAVSGAGNATLNACHAGDLTHSVELRNVPLTDCFVNAETQLHILTEDMTRCYGFVTIRLREGGASVPTISDCVFVGKATSSSSDSLLYTNYTPASFGEIIFTDCVISGYGTAVSLERAEAPGLWQASGSAVDSCTFFDNTNDFGTNASAEVGTTITNSVFTDPQLGDTAGSVTMNDFAAGAGTDGFASGAAVVTGPPDAEDDSWTYADLAALGLTNGQSVRFTATDDSTTDQVLAGGALTVPPGHWKLIHGPL